MIHNPFKTMQAIIQTSADEVPYGLSKEHDVFIFSISYEQRSSVICNKIGGVGCKILAFHNANHDYLLSEVVRIRNTVSNLTVCSLDSDSPLRSFDAIRAAVLKLSETPELKRVVIDVSCFTREALAMLIVVLKHVLSHGIEIRMLYTQAADYPRDEGPATSVQWFSRGISEVRSILGYRGSVQLLAKTHLILLPGFETERAQAIVDTLEPDRLTVGRIPHGESIQPAFAERALRMAQHIESCYPGRFMSYCEFSARDPFLTRDSVSKVIDGSENTVIACLNTKIAMVGTCLAALQHPAVQLIYSQPLKYNIGVATAASDRVIMFDI